VGGGGGGSDEPFVESSNSKGYSRNNEVYISGRPIDHGEVGVNHSNVNRTDIFRALLFLASQGSTSGIGSDVERIEEPATSRRRSLLTEAQRNVFHIY